MVPRPVRHSPAREVRDFVLASLVVPVEGEPADATAGLVRRRVVVAVTLLLGSLGLGWAISVRPGDPLFTAAALAVAGIWAGGAFASGRLTVGRARTRAGGTSWSVVQSLVLGGALLAVFLLAGLVVARLPQLRDPVDRLLDHARYGSLPLVTLTTVVSGVAEELFFRGALFVALPTRVQVVGSSVVYGLATLLTGVPLLVVAALVLGLLVGAQRRVTGGILGPVVTHLTWSVGMLYLLPLVLDVGRLT